MRKLMVACKCSTLERLSQVDNKEPDDESPGESIFLHQHAWDEHAARLVISPYLHLSVCPSLVRWLLLSDCLPCHSRPCSAGYFQSEGFNNLGQ